MSANPSFLTDEEIFAIVHPLVQPAAIVRWFKSTGFTDIKVRPNGLPLIARAYFDQVTAGTAKAEGSTSEQSAQPNVQAYLDRISKGAKSRAVSPKV